MLRYGAVTNATEFAGAERLAIAGMEPELVRRGAGRPVLLLHGAQTVDPRARFLELLGRHAEIIAPSHPGFGRSARPAGFETVYDLVHFYLDVLEALPHEKVTLIGLSFGGTRVRGGGMSVDVDHVLGDRPPRGQSNRATLPLQRRRMDTWRESKTGRLDTRRRKARERLCYATAP